MASRNKGGDLFIEKEQLAGFKTVPQLQRRVNIKPHQDIYKKSL